MKLLQTLAILLSVVGAAYAQIPSNIPTNGLQAWYPFNGNANDESGNAHHGTVSGATPSRDRFLQLNKAYTYNGTNSTINYGNGVNMSVTFSVSFWVRTTMSGFTTFPNTGIILSKENDGATTHDWTIGIGTNGNIIFKQGCNGTGCSFYSETSGGIINDGKWHHIVVVRSGNAVVIYNNNVPNFNPTSSSALTNQTANLISGYCNLPAPQNPVAPAYFNGEIDDIAIWDRILSAAEVDAIFDNYTTVCGPATAGAYLHGNNIRAYIPNNGGLFFNGQEAGFNVPYNSSASQQTNTLYAGGLWLGGYDAGGNLKLAAQTYNQNGADYYQGVLDTLGNKDTAFDCFYNKVWKVDAAEVLAHINAYVSNGGVLTQIDSSILYWPGKNNPNYYASIGYYLPSNRDFAPFYDRNNDGTYNPFDGDYPVYEDGNPQAIAASMTFSIFNDNGSIHTSTNGQPLKAEVHLLSFALNCSNDPILNNTIFTRHSIISRNPIPLYNVRAALWIHGGLGCYLDDYVGTSIADNAIFIYNADADDNINCFGATGYGAFPPVQSIKLLNRTLSGTAYYENSNDAVRGIPGSSIQHYRLMDGKWLDGRPVSYGGNGDNGFSATPFPYVYTSPPDSTAPPAWSMPSTNTIPSDYRNLMNINIDTFLPYSTEHIDAAFVYHRDFLHPGLFEMVDLVYSELPQVQNWYDNGFPTSCAYSIPNGAETIETIENNIKAFPNPTHSELNIVVGDEMIGQQYVLYNVMGIKVFSGIFQSTTTLVDMRELSAGMYFLAVEGFANQTLKIIKH